MSEAPAAPALGYRDLLRMQRELGTAHNRAIWNVHSTSGKLNIIRALATLSAATLAGYAAHAHGPVSPVALGAAALAAGNAANFVLANLLSLRITVMAEWILRLGRGDLDYRVRLAGDDQLAWMCEALERLRRRSIEVVRLPQAQALAQALQERNAALDEHLRKLRCSREQLVAQHKANEIGELVAGVAHEIRNPLNFVQNFAEGAGELIEEMRERDKAKATQGAGAQRAERERARAEAAGHLAQIAANARRVNRIVERVIGLGASSGTTEAMVVNELVAEQARIATQTAGNAASAPDIALVLALSEDVGQIRGNARAIARVVSNLVTNACDALREGGGETPQIRVETRRRNNRVDITVRDNGPGLDPGIAARVTEAFVTTKPPHAGAGLGLSQCADIIREHAGTLTIDSAPGEGTTVRVELPDGEPPAGRGAQAPEGTGAAVGV